MSTLIVVQARMASTRLPGKVMMPLAGQPMLARLLERLRHVRKTDALVVATTVNPLDDVIALWCQAQGVASYRGSEDDVLSRYASAASAAGVDVVVRVTSDCPLLDPALVDQAIAAFETGDCDYLSNMLPPSWPYGMAIEVFYAQALMEANREATLAAEREHVTPFIYWHPERYRIRNLVSPQDLSHHRWTVDTPEDYKLVKLIFENLFPGRPNFSLVDVLSLIDAHPDWLQINRHIEQKQAAPNTSFLPILEQRI